ncbi:hypothetical protein CYMTET_9506 [Cymbomonas tetramitiformis]|uniref:Uncharacterized protein n=1 Tax=Cymbomonas tetramitiformis TaxID=36881 RepID=A0AAE0GR43_9CHLO|nr:hypothetical protein CYMTET_9506 [Cymbomonas tetramitiformis]
MLPAYGFTVEPQPPADEPAGDDIHQRLDDLAAEVHAAANCKVHYTHASFPPRAVLEPHASALVCGPAAAGNMPEEQTVSSLGSFKLSTTPPSRRLTSTATYDTDDYEDFADGSFRLKPRGSPPSANHVSGPPVDDRRTYGCGKPPWGFPPTVGPWGVPFLLSLILCISIMGVAAVPDAQSAAGLPSPGGDLDWETPSIFSTNEFVESVIPAQGFFVADNVRPLEPPEPPGLFQDLAQADLGFDMAHYYGMALHEAGPLDAEHYYCMGFAGDAVAGDATG